MLILALDTATPAVTVAVRDRTGLLAESSAVGARRHGELLAPMLRDALAEAGRSVGEVTDVVVGVGPGPFTSLRIGIVTALAFAVPAGLPVHGICSLDALAHEALGDPEVRAGLGAGFLVATDARRREVYWAHYDAAGARASDPSVDRPEEVAAAHPGLPVVGEGGLIYPELLGAPVGPTYPRAGVLAELAVASLAAQSPLLPPIPLYLRRPDTSAPAERKRVLR